MSKQLTVRLADDLVDYIDQEVAAGQAHSRAAVVADAVERARRRQVAERDAAILVAARPGDDDLDDLAEFAAAVPLDDLA
jgi:Arc/MetJ-type ribon-helix-helix transcriptional regulator